MKIEYETTPADAEAWQQHVLTLPASKRAIRRQVGSMAFTTGLLVGAMAYGSTRNLIAAFLVGGVLFLVIAALAGSALRDQILKNARRALAADPTNPALGYHTLEITPEAVTETSSHHVLSVRWDAVASAIRTENHLFIQLRSLAAIIVPLRSFSSTVDQDAFIRFVVEFVPSYTSPAATAPAA